MQVKASNERLTRNDRGATAVEYSLIAMLIALGLLAALQMVGGEVQDTWTGVADKAAT